MDRRLAALALVGLLAAAAVIALSMGGPPTAGPAEPTATPTPEPTAEPTETPTATPTPEPPTDGGRDATETPEGELEPGDPGYKPVIRNGSATGSGDGPVVGGEAVANATVS